MRICVFCGSSGGRTPRYADAARNLGAALAQRGIGLVYGGAQVGTMGTLADAALAAGGEVIGVMPQHLIDREIAHPGLTQLQVTADLHARKARMAELADAFVALPGGAGTLDELCEIWTWRLLGLHTKPIGLLDVDGYYGPLLACIDHMVAEGFVRGGDRDLLTLRATGDALLDRLVALGAT